jgi:hypothetical protein
MHEDPPYRLTVRSDGEALLLTVEGAAGPARAHVSEVTATAAKLGIPVYVEHSTPPADGQETVSRLRGPARPDAER